MLAWCKNGKYIFAVFKQNVTFFHFEKIWILSGRHIIALIAFLFFFFWIYLMFTYQISAQMCTKFSLQLSSKAQNPKVVQHSEKCFWFMTLFVEHYSGKQPGSDPWPHYRCQHIHPNNTHVWHTAHSYRQTRRHSSNNEKKVVNYSIRRCGVYDTFFFLACFILFFVFLLIYGTF